MLDVDGKTCLQNFTFTTLKTFQTNTTKFTKRIFKRAEEIENNSKQEEEQTEKSKHTLLEENRFPSQRAIPALELGST